MKNKYILLSMVAVAHSSLSSIMIVGEIFSALQSIQADEVKNCALSAMSMVSIGFGCGKLAQAYNSHVSLNSLNYNHAEIKKSDKISWNGLPLLNKESDNYGTILSMYESHINAEKDLAHTMKKRSLIKGGILIGLGLYGLSRSR